MNDHSHPRHLTFSSWPPQPSSARLTCRTNDWGLHFSVQKASRQQSSVWGVTWHKPDKLKPQRARGREWRVRRVLMTSNYWSQELESQREGRGRPLQGKQERRHGVKQSQLSSMPAVLCPFLPCSSSFDWSWDVCSTGLQYAALFSPELCPCSLGQPRPAGCAAWPGRALALGSPADLSQLRSCQSFVTHRESRGMADTTIRFRCLALALFSPPIGPVSSGQPIRGGSRRW